jgi:two-component system LytT family sensor kinase
MPMKCPKYISQEYQLMLAILLPFSILLNFLIFGENYLSSISTFVSTTLISLTIQSPAWQLHTVIAMRLSQRYPKDGETMKRIGISLLFFFPLTALVNSSIYGFYWLTGIGDYQFVARNYILGMASGVGLNLLATFMHEGVANFEKWKVTLTETEQLKTEYAKSRLEGLKTQVNPHFLFNSINTLSSLISQDPEKAEVFLDEMCKVYRYLLKKDKGEFIELQKELQFINSWFFILKVRYGTAVSFNLDVTDDALNKQIPPLTLQLLVEHILNRHMISKLKPLAIRISTSGSEWLALHHTISRKINAKDPDKDNSMSNVINKFRLLDLAPIRISQSEGVQIIEIPLS